MNGDTSTTLPDRLREAVDIAETLRRWSDDALPPPAGNLRAHIAEAADTIDALRARVAALEAERERSLLGVTAELNLRCTEVAGKCGDARGQREIARHNGAYDALNEFRDWLSFEMVRLGRERKREASPALAARGAAEGESEHG